MRPETVGRKVGPDLETVRRETGPDLERAQCSSEGSLDVRSSAELLLQRAIEFTANG